MVRSRLIGIFVTMGVIGALVVAAPVTATHVTCGAVLTTNTTLDSDIGPCAGDGLVIGASGITVNLNGHTISGAGGVAGIRIAQVSGVTVKNGTITGFSTGVQLDEADGNRVRQITATGNGRGINVSGSDNNLIVRNTLTNNSGDGIRLGLSSSNAVRENVVTGNPFGIAIADFSSGNTVSENDVSANRDFGIALFSQATNNKLIGNTIGGTTQGDGISVSADSTGSKVRRNTANVNADDGIQVDSAGTLIVDNTANDNGDLGIEAVPGIRDGGGNSASGNGDPRQCVNVPSCEVAVQ